MARTEERLDRKALKEDALRNFVEGAGEYARANLNMVLGVAAGVVVLVLLGILWRQDSSHKAVQADQSLSQVVLAFSGGAFQQVLDLSNALQSNSPGSRAAVLSKYLAGASQMRLGQFPEAEQSLRSYLESAAKYPFYETAARTALAACLEAQGKFADAATAYQELAAKLSEPMAGEHQLSAARALVRAGSVDQAKTILEKIASETTANSRQAKLELAVLESAH